MSVWPNPGVYPNMDPASYFGLKEIGGVLVRSNSMLHAFDRDPKEFKAGHEKKATDAMRRGSIFDCLITQQHRFDKEYVISEYDEFRSNDAKAWRSAQDRVICKQSEFEEAEKAVHAVHADPRWKAITAGNCQYQVGIRADVNGLPFKAMFDILPDKGGEYGDAIVDLKRLSCMDSVEDVLRTCRRFLYNHQMGLYRGLANIAGLKRKRAILFIVPQSGPVSCCVLELGEQMLANGAHALMRINDRLIECERTGIWPSRFDGIKRIEQADETWLWAEAEADPEECSL